MASRKKVKNNEQKTTNITARVSFQSHCSQSNNKEHELLRAMSEEAVGELIHQEIHIRGGCCRDTESEQARLCDKRQHKPLVQQTKRPRSPLPKNAPPRCRSLPGLCYVEEYAEETRANMCGSGFADSGEHNLFTQSASVLATPWATKHGRYTD